MNELINKSRVQLVDIVIKAEKFYGVHDMMLDLIYSLRREKLMAMFNPRECGWQEPNSKPFFVYSTVILVSCPSTYAREFSFS